jgi:hypothetical protein
MNKQEIMRDMKKDYGPFMTITDIAHYLRQGRDSARTLVSGLEYFNAGRAKKYFVGDVADRIMKKRAV